MSNYRYPNITGRTNEEKIGQIVSFLRQLVDQLNYEGASVSAEEINRKLEAIQDQLSGENKG